MHRLHSTPGARRATGVPRAAAAAALSLTAAALTLGACSRGNADARTTDSTAVAAVTVGRENIAVVQLGDVRTGPSLSGTLAPERAAAIRAELGGSVLRIGAEPGQRVARGELLAVIDDRALGDALISARSGVRTAQMSLEVAQRNEERADRLAKAGAIAERDLEQARWNTTNARGQLADAQARLAQAERQHGSTQVRAPFTGVVSARQASVGDVVGPGAPLFTVVDPSSMQLEASVPAEQLGAVRVGAPVSFTVTGYPGRTFSGRVSRVAPVADPATRQVQIIATLPNVGSQLVGGLFAEGRVASAERRAPMVPLAVVDQRGLAPTVVRIKGGKVEKVTVQLGLRDAAAETVEIRAGLAPGDTILLGAAQGISPGTPVVVSDPNDQRRGGSPPAAR